MNEQQTTSTSSDASSVPSFIGSLNLDTYSECQRVRKDITAFRTKIVRHVPIPPGEYFEFGMYLESFRMYLSDILAMHESNYRSIRAAYLSAEGESAASA